MSALNLCRWIWIIALIDSQRGKMTASIKWGILGAGDVCEVKSGPAFQKAQKSELTAVMRRDGEKAADFARRHRVGTWYDSVEGLLADPEIDAVYIATPPRYHLDHCLAALAAGKHVYLEKPMGMWHWTHLWLL